MVKSNNLEARTDAKTVLENLKKKVKSGFVKEGILDIEVIELTEKFANELKNNSDISQNLIRNIYDSFKTAQIRLQREFVKLVSDGDVSNVKSMEEQAFKKILPQIKLMKSKANYVLERKIAEDKTNREVYPSLKSFIFMFIDNIRVKAEFDAFMDLFECVIGSLK